MKSIRFPDDLIARVEEAITGTGCSFSAFVVAAVRAALDDLDENGRQAEGSSKAH